MNKVTVIATLPLAITLLPNHSFGGVFAESHFDTGLDGWTAVGDGAITWQAAGGNPGGFLQAVDPGTGVNTDAVAPAAFHGDWSVLNNVGILTADLTIIAGGDVSDGVRFQISGPGGSAYVLWPPWDGPPHGSWATYRVDISEAEWTVTDGAWAALLSDVNELLIDVEHAAGVETTGLDNVVLATCPCSTCDVDGSEVCAQFDIFAVLDCMEGDCTGCVNSCDLNCDGHIDVCDICIIECGIGLGWPEDPACCIPCGACCTGSDCHMSCAGFCDDMGEVYLGDGTSCEPNPCCIEDTDCDDNDVCTADSCDVVACLYEPNVYGDTNHSGHTNVQDVLCIRDNIGGDETECSDNDADVAPCEGDVPNVLDMIAVLHAISGFDLCCTPVACCLPDDSCIEVARGQDCNDLNPPHAANHYYSGLLCTDPVVTCPYPAPAMAASSELTRARSMDRVSAAPAEIKLVSSARVVRPGDTVEVHAFVTGAMNVLGYDVKGTIGGLRRGSAFLVPSIQDRRDALMSGVECLKAENELNGRAVAASLDGAVSSFGTAYLCTFTITVSDDALGTLVVDLVRDPLELVLRTSSTDQLEVNVTPARIVVDATTRR